MAKNNIKARAYMLGIKMLDIVQIIVQENQDHPQLSKVTPAKLSKAIQEGYIGSDLDRLIEAEADRVLRELETERATLEQSKLNTAIK